MLAVDTNVIIRLIVEDDPIQLGAVRRLLRNEVAWIAKSVLLEAIWVLEWFYKYDRAAVRELLESLISMDNVEIEDEAEVVEALDLMSHGVDAADALHLASTPPGIRFVTFDKDLVRRATRAGATHVSAL